MAREDSKMLPGLKCQECGKLYYPPRHRCNRCAQDNFTAIFLKGKGEVYSFAVIRVPFEEFIKDAPFIFAEVKLDEGLTVPARFTNEKEKQITVGAKVRYVSHEDGVNWFELI